MCPWLSRQKLRWLKERGQPVAYIWCREFGGHYAEHLHIDYHMRPQFDAAYAMQLADWSDEDLGRLTSGELQKGGIAVSDEHGWLIKGCVHGNTSGEYIAAYLGKAEPNEITTAWGKIKKNEDKPKRRHKGTGPIEGTSKHDYRSGTSNSLAQQQIERYADDIC